MAQFNGSNEHGKRSYESGEERQWFSSRHVPALTAGLVIVALFVGAEACSRKSSNSNTAASARPAISEPAPAPATPAAAAPATAPVAKRVRKARRRRASVITYANNDYGVRFRYPRKYDLKLGEEAQLTWPGLGPVQTSFPKTGGVTVAAVAMPENSFPGTDFASGFLNLSVNSGITAAECMQFAVTGKAVSATSPAGSDPVKIEIGKLEFSEVEKVTDQDPKQADVKYYHAFQNNACYEFALGVGTVGDDSKPDVAQVDRSKVFGELEKILASVHFKPVEVPITAPAADSLSHTPLPDSSPATAPSAIAPVMSNRT
jgi:hypothetical protein